MVWVNAILQGILLGGMFALFATGLSLMFGVMRLVNLAHGDFIILAAFLAIAVVDGLGIGPFLSLVVVIPAMFGIGYAVQWGMLNRLMDRDILPPLLVTFGLSIILQNGLLEIFSADTRRLQVGALETASLQITDSVAIGWFPLLVFLCAIAVIWSLQLLFYRTALGRAFRATSDNPAVAQLMGLDTRRVFALAMAVAMVVVAIAGVLMAMRTNVTPTIGPARLLFAFEAVIIGGLGNLWGTLLGAILLGVAQAIGAQIHPGAQILAGHIVFLLVLVLRPSGLFPRTRD